MPCWTIISYSLKLKGADPAILDAVLSALYPDAIRKVKEHHWIASRVQLKTQTGQPAGYGTVSVRDGVVTVEGEFVTKSLTQQVANQINRGYAEASMRATALRYGWMVRQTAEREFELVRR